MHVVENVKLSLRLIIFISFMIHPIWSWDVLIYAWPQQLGMTNMSNNVVLGVGYYLWVCIWCLCSACACIGMVLFLHAYSKFTIGDVQMSYIFIMLISCINMYSASPLSTHLTPGRCLRLHSHGAVSAHVSKVHHSRYLDMLYRVLFFSPLLQNLHVSIPVHCIGMVMGGSAINLQS